MGMDTVRAKLRELTSKSDLSKVEEDMLVSLEACYEDLRGFKFAPIDLYTSHANGSRSGRNLLPPFNSVNGRETARQPTCGKSGRNVRFGR